MPGTAIVSFADLQDADLTVDAVYKGGSLGDIRDDPIGRLLGCGNAGGFRYVGRAPEYRMAVLYSSLNDPDWPDFLDPVTGRFVYYGDNKTPGRPVGSKKGNRLLEHVFRSLHARPEDRRGVPPFFIFTKGPAGYDAVFRGLAAPGAAGVPETEDLVAIWRTTRGQRFQNYRAIFTILDIPVIPRSWIRDIQCGKPASPDCPGSWLEWQDKGVYRALTGHRTVAWRSQREQLPSTAAGRRVLHVIHKHFAADPYGFEACAAELLHLMDERIGIAEVTRRSADGGRDLIGEYRVGPGDNTISIDFAVEAKCFAPGTAVGVRHTSRLISRLRHRQFGVLMTTSYLAAQAYRELIEDAHPVLVISGGDIVRILADAGHGTPRSVLSIAAPCVPLAAA